MGAYSRGGTCLTFSKTTKVAQALVQLVVFEKLQVLICMRKHVTVISGRLPARPIIAYGEKKSHQITHTGG